MKIFDLEMQRFQYDIENNNKFKDMYVENLEIDAKEFIPEVERPDGPYKIGGMSSYALDQQRLSKVTVAFPGFKNYNIFIAPLEQGGGGATKKNSSQQTATLPKWLYNKHVAGKLIS